MPNEQPELQRVSSEALFALARELFAMGKRIKFVVVGSSMFPFIRHDKDMVTLAGATFDHIRTSDIVLAYKERQNKYVLHRVVKKAPQSFYMAGDAQTFLDGPYPPEALIGIVTAIHRIDKRGGELVIAGRFYKLLARLWLLIRPFRPAVFFVYALMRGRVSIKALFRRRPKANQ